ncbi:segregation/condensation protein A [Kordiimonas sp. SCSIO 12603]|uniref:segregation and condensation protein A n=1 Tax=Kordiimonas sp. SCSIO 12603 TaxID=2829596 RepID=UPI00210738FC|nr:ScpA family protein [Kordiimonas sp. SCSIO 12603]UTW57687.1 segregation/condensation protein A [Kordiimonas sp. SCSIO 12603]
MVEVFEEDSPVQERIDTAEGDPNQLVLHMEGFEGPLDVLLTLARAQKVDLAQISILELVEQFLEFVSAARRLKLELAADYLVMAAWLAYLKSRLLLPKEENDEEPSAEELAFRLQLRLQRLEAMREVGAQIMGRDRMGRDVFRRGAPEGLKLMKNGAYDVTLYELLRAYADNRQKHTVTEIKIERRPVFALEDAIERLSDLIGTAFTWSTLSTFLPEELKDQRLRKSALASMFAASLELARQGQADLRQMEAFGPIYLRHRDEDDPTRDTATND